MTKRVSTLASMPDAVGRLVNGQHRLMAVLITRKPQVFPIIRRKE